MGTGARRIVCLLRHNALRQWSSRSMMSDTWCMPCNVYVRGHRLSRAMLGNYACPTHRVCRALLAPSTGTTARGGYRTCVMKLHVGGNPSVTFALSKDNVRMPSSWLACIQNRCRPCPSGATCPGGAVVLARQGWWEGSDATFYKCDDSAGCCPHGNCMRGTATACATYRLPTSRLCSQCEAGLQLWCVAGLHCMLHLCCCPLLHMVGSMCPALLRRHRCWVHGMQGRGLRPL